MVPKVAILMFNGFASGDSMLSLTAVFAVVLLGVFGTLVKDFARTHSISGLIQ